MPVLDVNVDVDVPAAGGHGDCCRTRDRCLVAERRRRQLPCPDDDIGMRVNEPDLGLGWPNDLRWTGEDDARVEPGGQVRGQQVASATDPVGRSLVGAERDRRGLQLRPNRGPVEPTEERCRRVDYPVEESRQAHRKMILVSSPTVIHPMRATRRYHAHSSTRARPPSPKSGTTPERPPIRVISGYVSSVSEW